jgi:hypothetical protein
MATQKKMPAPKKAAVISEKAGLDILQAGNPRLKAEASKHVATEQPTSDSLPINEQTMLFPDTDKEQSSVGVPARRGRPPGQGSSQRGSDKEGRAAIYINENLQLEIAQHLLTLRKSGDRQTQKSFIEKAVLFYINSLRETGVLPNG